MAILKWIGAASTDSQDVNNWHISGGTSHPSALGATDTYILNEDALQECQLNHQVLGNLVVEDGYVTDGFQVKFNHATPTFIAMSFAHNTVINWQKSATEFTHTGTQATGTPWFNQPIVVEGLLENAGYALSTVSFVLKNTQSTAAYLPTGSLSSFTLHSGKWTTNNNPNASALNTAQGHSDTHKLDRLKLDRLRVQDVTWNQTQVALGDELKHIQVTSNGVSSGLGLTCTNTLLDFSNVKLTIDAKNSATIPTSNDSNFGASSNFILKVEELVIGNANGDGNIAKISAGHTLECSSLEIQSGVMLYGVSAAETDLAAYIHCIEKPILRGTWNFEEVSDGIYKTVKGASTISVRNVKSYTGHILSDLTVEGLVKEPIGITLTPTGSNPGAAGGADANTLWLNSGDSNKLYRGAADTAGSGGSGDITGVTIQTDSGSGSKATDTGGSADFSLLGANGVGVTNSGATITAVAVERRNNPRK